MVIKNTKSKKMAVAKVEEAVDDGIDTPEGREYFQNDGTILVKPHDQLKLSEKELQQEILVILSGMKPKTDSVIYRYSYQESCYVPIPSNSQLNVHISLHSGLIPEEEIKLMLKSAVAVKSGSADLENDLEEEQSTEHSTQVSESELQAVISQMGFTEEQQEEEIDEEQQVDDDKEDIDGKRGSKKLKEKKATNQFNFTDRAALTYYMRPKSHETMTQPPPQANLTSQVNQWIIYDAYRENWLIQEREKNKDKRGGKIVPVKKLPVKKSEISQFESQTNDDYLSSIGFQAKIIERMINQNIYEDILKDYKYFEDESDEFRDGKGTLLPLWKFKCDRSKKLSVTCTAWSPVYKDLFGVGFGSFNFVAQQDGVMLFHSLKNPSNPEYEFTMQSGCMSLEMYDVHPYLVAVGLYDGNVAVYNLKEGAQDNPVWFSSVENKHLDPVWQVRWLKKDLDENLCMASISSDGNVAMWTIINKDMLRLTLITLEVLNLQPDIINGTQLITLAGGNCFSFHPRKPHIYLVGTCEGEINLCSTYYRKAFIRRYQAHSQSIYGLAWNPFHDNVFITCGADWTVKIWDLTATDQSEMFSFDLGGSVGGIAWAPYSSTVFAAVTSSGKAYVFDLNVNKYEPLCEQMVASRKKSKLICVAFNPIYPIINIGDDVGRITCLKLSPNLRKRPKEKKHIPGSDAPVLTKAEKDALMAQFENEKLEKILMLVRNQNNK